MLIFVGLELKGMLIGNQEGRSVEVWESLEPKIWRIWSCSAALKRSSSVPQHPLEVQELLSTKWESERSGPMPEHSLGANTYDTSYK